MAIPTAQVQLAVRHLQKADPRLKPVIAAVGPFKLSLERNRFRMLVRSILAQQLSTGAARTIRTRVEALLPAGKMAASGMTAEAFQTLTPAQLRAAGVSGPKATYLLELTDAVLSRRVRLDRIARKSDEEIIAELTQVKGIGRWTAQMFLIFSLGRLDVFPFDDLGVRAAIRNIHALPELPDKVSCRAIADRWRPYATVASWYCWRSLDLPKTTL